MTDPRPAPPNADRETTPDESHPRWTLLRDVLVFQAKLLVDGLRDLLMSPISLVCALAGILFEPGDPARLFRHLQRFGRRTEAWINLFGHSRPEGHAAGIDELFAQLEHRIVEQHARGGATASAKRVVDRSLDGLNERIERLRRRAGGVDSNDDSTDD